MKRLIKKALALFAKPKEEVKLENEVWTFPIPAEVKKPKLAKATTRKAKPAAKKTAKKVAAKKTVAKKTAKKKAE